MSFDWRQHSSEELEQHFNPRLNVGDDTATALLAEFAAQSAKARQVLAGQYNIRYAEGGNQVLDFHPAGKRNGERPPPLLFFIHGGFWRALDKDDHSMIAPAFVDAGIAVANVNYDLCPAVSLDEIVAQMRRALLYAYENAAHWGADPQRIFLAGHSAGAHLAYMLLASEPVGSQIPAAAIGGVAALSGIYEPAIVRQISIQEDVQLSEEMAVRNNCLSLAPRAQTKLLCAVGGDETVGWQAQSTAFSAHCRKAGMAVTDLIVPGTNHFTLFPDAAAPDGQCHQAMIAMIRGQ